jgi:hypothetical protein
MGLEANYTLFVLQVSICFASPDTHVPVKGAPHAIPGANLMGLWIGGTLIGGLVTNGSELRREPRSDWLVINGEISRSALKESQERKQARDGLSSRGVQDL